MTSSHQELRFTSEDGLQIPCNRWPGVFHILDGLGDNSGQYAELAALLYEANQPRVVRFGVQNGFPSRRSCKCKLQG